jgi:hypothetical protein
VPKDSGYEPAADPHLHSDGWITKGASECVHSAPCSILLAASIGIYMRSSAPVCTETDSTADFGVQYDWTNRARSINKHAVLHTTMSGKSRHWQHSRAHVPDLHKLHSMHVTRHGPERYTNIKWSPVYCLVIIGEQMGKIISSLGARPQTIAQYT